ncbi:ATPase family associated with various cellular activities (AAA) [Dehalogenimonas alkenigignens]|uniref:ATPase family associated with various cellular activities (AAA) n=1 Tax=Dehalogenimonas alkenigignens TaxID=1217799 RepID=A0A0W0GKB0_9CHLR|nr:ATP-binding protein [Dehalogenimonas alkenigignens]KTB49005.1 ATPase family associated with various cellular activities (AAA) [Dehalogenimonas alkenigignens]
MKEDNTLELLSEIARFEDSVDMDKDYRIGWGWRHVRIWPATLSRLFKDGYLENVFRSNSHTGYRLSEMGKSLLSAENAPAETRQEPNLAETDTLFGDIIGHDGVKELLRASLLAEKPVHVLLTGPPALAKTLFLWDIERAGGEKAIWLVGSATSKAGLWDLVAEREPGILLIDEIDKMNAADTAALLTMMEGGRLVRAKRGRELNLSNPLRVIAASNRSEKLSPELRSRFAIRQLLPYGRAEYLTVVQGVLVRCEGLSPELAGEIASRLDGLTQNVRDAIRVARLAPQLGVEKAIGLLLGGETK